MRTPSGLNPWLPKGEVPAVPIHLLPPSCLLLLLAQPLAQRLEQLVPAAEGFDAAFLLLAQQPLGELLQPFGRQLRDQLLEQLLRALEMFGEHAVEAVEVPLVLHHRHARQVIELFGGKRGHPGLERLEQ